MATLLYAAHSVQRHECVVHLNVNDKVALASAKCGNTVVTKLLVLHLLSYVYIAIHSCLSFTTSLQVRFNCRPTTTSFYQYCYFHAKMIGTAIACCKMAHKVMNSSQQQMPERAQKWQTFLFQPGKEVVRRVVEIWGRKPKVIISGIMGSYPLQAGSFAHAQFRHRTLV